MKLNDICLIFIIYYVCLCSPMYFIYFCMLVDIYQGSHVSLKYLKIPYGKKVVV